MATDTQYWIWLGGSLGYGSHAIKPLLERFGDPRGVFEASDAELAEISALCAPERKKLCERDLSRAEEVATYCLHGNVRVLNMAEADYPRALLDIPNPPAVLYVRGTIPAWNRLPCIGVVGARAMSYYGADAACEISYDLARMGCVTVSGMALGIDGVTAAATLEAGGKTVAVLGSGIDRLYPKEHRTLYRAILDGGGAIITEFPPYEGADAFHFPLRNRIISGLSRAVILVEGEANSGALITARYAKKQGKCVFAVPGKIGDKGSEAPHLLLKQDAKLLTCADDVYDELREEYFGTINPFALLPSTSLNMEGVLRKYGVAIGKRKEKEKKLLNQQSEAPRKGVLQRLRGLFVGDANSSLGRAPSGGALPVDDREAKRARLDAERKLLLSREGYAIYESLTYDTPIHPDEIELETVGADVAAAELITMEVMGYVTLTAGGCYLKNENE